MKMGEVVQIRVMPRHVQLSIAACEARGMTLAGMSLASVISHGLKISLDTLAANGLLPAPDPYAYAAQLRAIKQGASPIIKLSRTHALTEAHDFAARQDQPLRYELATSIPIERPALDSPLPSPMLLALEDLQAMTGLFSSWSEFFRENPYWPDRLAAGVTEEALRSAAGPTHPWNTASGTSSPESEAQA